MTQVLTWEGKMPIMADKKQKKTWKNEYFSYLMYSFCKHFFVQLISIRYFARYYYLPHNWFFFPLRWKRVWGYEMDSFFERCGQFIKKRKSTLKISIIYNCEMLFILKNGNSVIHLLIAYWAHVTISYNCARCCRVCKEA